MSRPDTIIFPWLLSVALMIIVTGCVRTVPTASPPIVSPPSHALRERLGPIGITTKVWPVLPNRPLDDPTHAGRPGRAVVETTAEDTSGCIIAVLFPPFARGGLYNAVTHHPFEEVDVADKNVADALKGEEVAALLQNLILAYLRDVSRLKAEPVAATEGILPNSTVTFDHILEIEVIDMRLLPDPRQGIIPYVSLNIDITSRLLKGSDNLCLYQRRWKYMGPKKDYFKMAADGAKILRTELDTAMDKLAAKIVNDLFIATEPEEIQKVIAGGPVRTFVSDHDVSNEGNPGICPHGIIRR